MAIRPKSEDKYVEKCSTAQSFNRTEMSTYRIGTLVIPTISANPISFPSIEHACVVKSPKDNSESVK